MWRVLAVLAFSVGVLQGQRVSAPEAMQDILVRVSCQGNLGAGLVFGIAEQRVYIATPWHVIRRCLPSEDVAVEFSRKIGRSMPAQLHAEHIDSDMDLAVISVALALVPQAANIAFDVLGKSNAIVENSVVRTLSHSGGNLWLNSRVDERVVSREDERITFQSQSIREGASGGALLDRNSQLVGMITVHDPPVTHAVSITSAIRRLRGWRYPVSLRERIDPVDSGPSESATVIYPTPPPRPRVLEERFSNTVFQMPAGWLRRAHPQTRQRIILYPGDNAYAQHAMPWVWIEITESGILRGDFEKAFDDSLKPPGYEAILASKSSVHNPKGFNMMFARGAMRNPQETVYFIQVSANPDDRYEEIVFCSTIEGYLDRYQQAFTQFLDSVDYENIRRERGRQ